MATPWLVIDFDSTFVTVESLELLAEIMLANAPAQTRDARIAEIRDMTRRAMAGHMPLAESLARRIELLCPRQEHVAPLVTALKGKVSPSFARHAGFLRRHARRIYVLSAGFHEYVDPVVRDFGIAPAHVIANRFVAHSDGSLDVDTRNPLAHDGGKVQALRELALPGPVVAVGDGISDLELGLSAPCVTFIAYTETVDRPEVSARTRHTAKDFDAVLACLRKREQTR